MVEFAFPGPLHDRLVEAVLSGRKTATSALVREYEVDAEPLPKVGDRGLVVDSHEEPVCVIETTDVDIVPLRDVPRAHAIAEGEGYETVADWRREHLSFWQSPEMVTSLGKTFEIREETPIVLERFEVVPDSGSGPSRSPAGLPSR